jgi:hypothetical protein
VGLIVGRRQYYVNKKNICLPPVIPRQGNGIRSISRPRTACNIVEGGALGYHRAQGSIRRNGGWHLGLANSMQRAEQQASTEQEGTTLLEHSKAEGHMSGVGAEGEPALRRRHAWRDPTAVHNQLLSKRNGAQKKASA